MDHADQEARDLFAVERHGQAISKGRGRGRGGVVFGRGEVEIGLGKMGERKKERWG